MTDTIQPSGYLLELSPDWIVERASQNVHHLLGESHVTLIDEPLGRFVLSQPLHDLRNQFSRLSGTTGIARAYRVCLTDDRQLVDVAFQQVDERVLLEIVPSPKDGLGEAFGTVGGLVDGLGRASGQALLEGGARRMRALTNFDRVTLLTGDAKATSSRAGVPFREGANATLSDHLPLIVADSGAAAIPLFPHEETNSAATSALMRAPTAAQSQELSQRGFVSTMRVPIKLEGQTLGEFRMAHTKRRAPNFEEHAAAELFAQFFALRMEIARLGGIG